MLPYVENLITSWGKGDDDDDDDDNDDDDDDDYVTCDDVRRCVKRKYSVVSFYIWEPANM